jgi:hypothetical protein
MFDSAILNILPCFSLSLARNRDLLRTSSQ